MDFYIDRLVSNVFNKLSILLNKNYYYLNCKDIIFGNLWCFYIECRYLLIINFIYKPTTFSLVSGGASTTQMSSFKNYKYSFN